eukprot:c19276_g1_i4.p1 GENE.c19276_g1_i4~~c19276_g1_i4.p1  ORF type:complete len:969 (+),score=194.56 c19276_g1_i4:14-2920(+)
MISALLLAGVACAYEVHVIPHSHCDPGYKKTFEGYYLTEVHRTLTSVTQLLAQNPSLRFLWSETSYLDRWWQDNPSQGAQFRELVRAGQIEIVNGGWVMHDEAITTYPDQITQLTYGHAVLRRLLGSDLYDSLPKHGWQIDPFGPSSWSPTLMALLGYDAAVDNRIPMDTKDLYAKNQSLQFVWRGSGSLDANSTQMLYHILSDHYNSVGGFDFEQGGEPITPANVAAKAQVYMNEVISRSAKYRSDILLVPFGTDFEFQNASIQFNNMSLVMAYINAHPNAYAPLKNVTIRYSTLAEYFAALRRTKTEFPTGQGSNFLPYQSWSGFYAGYLANKIIGQRAAQRLLTAESAVAWAYAHGQGVSDDVWARLDDARSQVSFFQHHDSAPGTGFDALHTDLYMRLKRSLASSQFAIAAAVESLSSTAQHNVREALLTATATAEGGRRIHVKSEQTGFVVDEDALLSLAMGQSITIVLVNSLAWSADTPVRITTARHDVVIVHLDPSDTSPIQQQVHPAVESGRYDVYFNAHVPAMGYASYVITMPLAHWTSSSPYPGDKRPSPPLVAPLAKTLNTTEVIRLGISNDRYQLAFSAGGCGLASVTLRKSGLRVGVERKFYSYISPSDSVYAFQPSDPPTEVPLGDCSMEAQVGPVVSQVRVFHPQAGVITTYRLFSSTTSTLTSAFFTVSHSIQPLREMENRAVHFQFTLGQEVQDGPGSMIYFENGYEPTPFTYDNSRPKGVNMKPFVFRAQVPIGTSTRLHILGTAPQGITSETPGSVEILTHRRILRFDTAGYLWADDRSAVDTSDLLFVLDQSDFGENDIASLMQNTNRPLEMLIGSATSTPFFQGTVPIAPKAISPAVHVARLAVDKDDGSVLFQVQHLLPYTSDPSPAQPEALNIRDFMPRAVSAIYTTASFARLMPGPSAWPLSGERVFGPGGDVQSGSSRGCWLGDDMGFTLYPMQICSYRIKIQ